MNRTTKSQPPAAAEITLTNYILFFFTCAFLGWVWEVVLTLFQTGDLVNRGVLHGPWLPIYGFGGLGIVFFLRRFRDHPVIVFTAAALGSGILEYITGWYLETFKHLRWWDYSDLWLNLDGRVCLLSVVTFGLCGLAVTYLLYPFFTRYFNQIPFRPKKILCYILILCFFADFIYSSDVPNTGEGITNEITTTETYLYPVTPAP